MDGDGSDPPRRPIPDYPEELAALQAKVAFGVGRAISEWAMLETRLAFLAGNALKMEDFERIALLASHIRSTSTLIEFVDACVRSRLAGQAMLERWNSIIAFVKELLGDRNFLAHNFMTTYRSPSGEVEIHVGPSLAGSILGKDRRDPMNAEEVHNVCEDIALANDLVEDFHRHCALIGPPPARLFRPISRRRPSIGERRSRRGAGQK